MKKFICLSLTLLFLASCLFGCGSAPDNNPQTGTDRATVQDIPPEEEAPEIEALSAAMDMENPISELYNMTLVEDSLEHIFQVPQINCESQDARRINKEIEENYSKIIDDAMESQRVGVSINCEYVKWALIPNGEYTFTLIISCSYPGDNRYYSLYNFNGFTGEEITNAEILEHFELSEEEFVRMAKDTAENTLRGRTGMLMEEDMEFYQYLLDDTLSDENINANMPMFIDENGSLCVIAAIGSLAGAGFSFEILRVL